MVCLEYFVIGLLSFILQSSLGSSISVFYENELTPGDVSLQNKGKAKAGYGELIRTINFTSRYSYGLVQLKKGNLATSGQFYNGSTYYGILDIWDPDSGKLLNSITHNESFSQAIAELKNGGVACGTYNNKITIWNPQNGRLELTIMNINNNGFSRLAALEDGNLASSGYSQKSSVVLIWDTKTGQLLRNLSDNQSPNEYTYLTSLAVLYNGNIAGAVPDARVIIWNPKTGNVLRTLSTNSGHISSLAALNKGNLAVAGSSNSIQIWDANNGNLIRTITNSVNWVFSLKVLKDGNLVGGSGSTLSVWKPETGELVATINDNQYSLNFVEALKNGDLASTNGNSALKIWNFK